MEASLEEQGKKIVRDIDIFRCAVAEKEGMSM